MAAVGRRAVAWYSDYMTEISRWYYWQGAATLPAQSTTRNIATIIELDCIETSTPELIEAVEEARAQLHTLHPDIPVDQCRFRLVRMDTEEFS